jgi:metal transporter CNNM
MLAASAQQNHVGGYPGRNPAAVSLANVLIVGLINLPRLRALALPLGLSPPNASAKPEEPPSPDDASLWLYLSRALALVLLGGIFAGLTIAYVSI